MNEPAPPPLNADPLRQATGAFRGYRSQIVRTTRAWVDLEDREVLYVEGAEDFDHVSSSASAEAVQVRDVAGNITLSTRKVLEALVHFWTHQRNNPRRKVSFCYLTTAGRGRERDPRFSDRAGLDYWDDCRALKTDPQPLREFLADHLGRLTKRARPGETAAQRDTREGWNTTVADLVNFVRESSDEKFRDGLVTRVTWETASPDVAEVLKDLEASVVETGERILAAKPSSARKAVPHLLNHVWDVACAEKGRSLMRTDFLQKLEETVDDVRVPLEEYNRLRAAASRSDAAVLPAEPSASSWYARVLHDRYTAAREAATAGRLKEADQELRQLLDSVRRSASAEDPERRRFEQGILLSRAQNALRSGNRNGAETLHREAVAIGRFENKNRHLAGWVLTNLGRPEEAVDELEPSDGTAEWQSTLGIALIGAGRLDRFRELFGDDQSQDCPDVLLALLRHCVYAEQAVRAENLAHRLVAQDGTPAARFRAVEAAFAVLQLTISLPVAPPVDAGEWILTLRRLFSDSEVMMSGGVPLLRLLVLRRRIEFHELLYEGDEAAKDFRTLVQAAPEMAAEIATFGVTGPRAVDLMAAREGARDPVHATIIDAVYFDTDLDVTLKRLRELESSVQGAEGEMLLILLLELAAAQGEDVTLLTERTGELSDPITQQLVKAGILRQVNRLEDASELIRAALLEHPESLRLLRGAYDMSRRLGPSEEEVELAERIYMRLPAPEFRLQLAESRMRSGDVDGALLETAAVEEEGTRRARAAYMCAQFALEARRMNEHAAAALRFFQADGSERGRLHAAVAALRARQYGSAEKLYRGLIESDDREVLLSAYGGLAHSVDAQGSGLASAREQSVAILLEGYDRLDGAPEIAGALHYRALGTRFEKDVHARIGRDFGSLANLPGMIAIPAEEGLEMIRREQEGAKLRIELFRAGVLPFATAVKLGHRLASYVWFAHRRDRVLMVLEPPRIIPRTEDPILPRQPQALLLDRTALLMLAETSLIDRVLQSDLPLFMARETYDWLEEEEHSLQAAGRPVQRQRLQELFKAINDLPNVEVMQPAEINEEVLSAFQSLLSWGDSYELTSASRDDLFIIDDFVDLDAVPEQERFRYFRSGDLLRGLLASEHTSIAEAAGAESDRPSVFGNRRGGPVPLDRRFLITHEALVAWHEAHLIESLAAGVDRLVVSPLAERHARDQLGERDAEADALAAISDLRESVVGAVDRGRVALVGREVDEPAGGDPAPEEGTDTLRDLLDGIGAPLREIYDQAAAAGVTVWSDDPAVHLYLDPLGPMISESVEIAQLASFLRNAYPTVNVVGTSNVMVWLEQEGLLSVEDRIELLDDVSAHGRAITGESAVFAKAARARATGAAATSVLDVAESMPAELSPDIVRRFSPRVSTAIAAAIAEVWFHPDGLGEEREESVQSLLRALGPWVAPSLPHARFTAESMWAALVGELVQRLGSETEDLLRLILSYAASNQAEFQHFLAGVWQGIDVLHGVTSEAPVDVRRLGAMLVAMLAVAGQDIKLHGRPILPDKMIRLAAELFGVEGILTHTASFERKSDTGESHVFTVEDAVLEEAAAASLDRLAEDPPKPAPANEVPVQVDVTSDDGTVRAQFRGNVDVMRILGRLTPPAKRFAVASLALYYRELAYPEIADSLEGLADEIASADAAAAGTAHRELLTCLLKSCRLWAEHDSHRAFSLLRNSPLEDLQRMAGRPEPWVAGETLGERTGRIRGGITNPHDFWEDVRALWGPFEQAVDQWMGLVLSLKAGGETNKDSVRNLIHASVTEGGTYDRVIALGTALAMVQMRPDLADAEIGVMELALEGETTRIELDGTASELLAELLAEWLRNECQPPALEDLREGTDCSDDTLSVRGVAVVHAMLDRLAVDVERYVYRAVLSESHDTEAMARATDLESGDSIGDLLLLGHRLTASMLGPVLRQAHRRGIVVVIRELEEAHRQYPLSQGRIPVREVFVPEVLGTGGRGVNPSLVLLLAFLCRLAQWRPDDNGVAADHDSAPFWLTDGVLAGLEALAGREGPPQLRNLQNLAHSEGISDRFGSLLSLGVEGHARKLMDAAHPHKPDPDGGGSADFP